MSDEYAYEQHERVAQRKEQGPVKVKDVAKAATSGSRIARFNEAVGLRITQSVGTMWAAYAFACLTLVSLPAAILSGSAIVIVAWIAQTFLQLVLLPIIIVGQNIQARAADARSAATYEDAGAILEESKQIQLHLEAQDRAISRILDQVKQLRDEAQAEVDENSK